MQLDSTLFVWFFCAVYALSWLAAVRPVLRIAVLVVASWAFYATWNTSLLLLIGFSTLLDFVLALRIDATSSDAVRRRLLAVSVCANLGLLGLFKYGDFAAESGNALAASLGLDEPIPVLNLVLPVGICFYTFLTMSYTIDVYRKRIQPTKKLLHFALYVCFFPQLIAGPIVRADDLLPQLRARPQLDLAANSAGLWLVAVGFTKKVLIADRLAVDFVDGVFESPALYSGLEALLAAYGYTVQIYCDFSGYTDVALGTALLLGIRLPENFDRPFQAASLAEFWRRWHKTLSFWLRDYLYIPLGGNRAGTLRTYRNLFLTMLLGGLWHGANWTFVVWGALHGVGLAAVRWTQRRRSGARMPRVLGIALTFHFVVFCFVIFRAESLSSAGALFTQVLAGGFYTSNLPTPTLALLAGALCLHWTPRDWVTQLRDRFVAWPSWVQGGLLAALAVALYQLQPAGAHPYIYYQF